MWSRDDKLFWPFSGRHGDPPSSSQVFLLRTFGLTTRCLPNALLAEEIHSRGLGRKQNLPGQCLSGISTTSHLRLDSVCQTKNRSSPGGALARSASGSLSHLFLRAVAHADPSEKDIQRNRIRGLADGQLLLDRRNAARYFLHRNIEIWLRRGIKYGERKPEVTDLILFVALNALGQYHRPAIRGHFCQDTFLRVSRRGGLIPRHRKTGSVWRYLHAGHAIPLRMFACRHLERYGRLPSRCGSAWNRRPEHVADIVAALEGS